MSAKYAFAKSLRELRFLFCHTSEQSAPVRSFLNRAYPIMKKNNPSIPVLLREASGASPFVYARYEYGQEKSESLAGLNDTQIEAKVTQLVKQQQ